jgi:hypothetical protein
VFPVTKKDQKGVIYSDPKHCYANPLQPALCFNLALCTHLMCHDAEYTASNSLIFMSATTSKDSQSRRFATEETKLLSTDEGKEKMKQYGAKLENLGIYSVRKGGATKTSSGSTTSCNIVAICLRANWKMGVQGRYFKGADAGDQFVGRNLAGLPVVGVTATQEILTRLPYPHFRGLESLKKLKLGGAFGLWWRGNQHTKVPPIRMLGAKDFCGRRSKVEYYKWNNLFSEMTECITKAGELVAKPDSEDVAKMLAHGRSALVNGGRGKKSKRDLSVSRVLVQLAKRRRVNV